MTVSRTSNFTLEGIVFGSDDFCASIGATRSSGAEEVAFARQFVITVAKYLGLQAVDVVYIDYRDLEGLKKQSEEGYKWGFTGKQIIHPTQAEIVVAAFSPSKDLLKWAAGLVSEFEKHQLDGKGAFTYQGKMIDRPLLLQAENILKMESTHD